MGELDSFAREKARAVPEGQGLGLGLAKSTFCVRVSAKVSVKFRVRGGVRV